MNITDLPQAIYDASMIQFEVKEKLLAAQRELSALKAELYLESEETHFVTNAAINSDEDVQKLQQKIDALELEHNRAWAQTMLYRESLQAMRASANEVSAEAEV